MHAGLDASSGRTLCSRARTRNSDEETREAAKRLSDEERNIVMKKYGRAIQKEADQRIRAKTPGG